MSYKNVNLSSVTNVNLLQVDERAFVVNSGWYNTTFVFTHQSRAFESSFNVVIFYEPQDQLLITNIVIMN